MTGRGLEFVSRLQHTADAHFLEFLLISVLSLFITHLLLDWLV
jgi:hypothetical protein